jgi:hypothetical protein
MKNLLALLLLLVASPATLRAQASFPVRGGGSVQGVLQQQANIAGINPVVAGAAQLPINVNFVGSGLDTYTPLGFSQSPAGGSATLNLGFSPTPAAPGSSALAVEVAPGDFGPTVVLAPWVCPPGVNCGGSGTGSTGFRIATNISSSLPYVRTFTNSVGGNDFLAFLVFNTANLGIRSSQLASNVSSAGFVTPPLKGSVLLATFACNLAPCIINKVQDTQGNLWNQVAYTTVGVIGNGFHGYSIWMTSAPTAAAGSDTITATPAAGNTVNEMTIVELTGISKSALFNTPGVAVNADQLGNVLVRQDAQGQNLWNCTVTLSTATTSICELAPTTTALNGLALRPYVTDFQFNTTAPGTGTTVQLQYGSGTNCATGLTPLSAIQYPNTAVGITSVFGVRTPLIGGQNAAICATQAGATPGTTVVEIRGFFAP